MEIHKNPLTNHLYHFVLGYVERKKLESLKINKGHQRHCEFYFTFIPLFVPLVLMLSYYSAQLPLVLDSVEGEK